MDKLLLYTSEDGKTRLDLRVHGETVWLTQREMAELFQVSTDNVSLHLKNIYGEGELSKFATTEESSVVQQEGERKVERVLTLYNLDAILAVGYRVRSARGVQFRKWANSVLKEYLLKGFVMDDERLKNPDQVWDYFDELLERIREIRTSEKRFYQKVRDLFKLSADYEVLEEETSRFYAFVQNKLLYAVSGCTAAELVLQRANPAEPNMALTGFKGTRVRKGDVVIAKNYLTEDELDTLNRLVVIFLEQAELRLKQRQELTLSFWQGHVDQMLEFNGQAVLKGAGSVSHSEMKNIVRLRGKELDQGLKSTSVPMDVSDSVGHWAVGNLSSLSIKLPTLYGEKVRSVSESVVAWIESSP